MKLPEDPEKFKVFFGYLFGFSVLLTYFVLALTFAFGNVQKENSYGLESVLAALGPLGGMFCGWAFGLSQRKNGS